MSGAGGEGLMQRPFLSLQLGFAGSRRSVLRGREPAPAATRSEEEAQRLFELALARELAGDCC